MKRVLCNQCGQSHVGWSLRVNCSCGAQFVSQAGGPLDLEVKPVSIQYSKIKIQMNASTSIQVDEATQTANVAQQNKDSRQVLVKSNQKTIAA
jgi:hypothetical protein